MAPKSRCSTQQDNAAVLACSGDRWRVVPFGGSPKDAWRKMYEYGCSDHRRMVDLGDQIVGVPSAARCRSVRRLHRALTRRDCRAVLVPGSAGRNKDVDNVSRRLNWATWRRH